MEYGQDSPDVPGLSMTPAIQIDPSSNVISIGFLVEQKAKSTVNAGSPDRSFFGPTKAYKDGYSSAFSNSSLN